MNKYEEMARKYIEGVGGLFDLYRYEIAPPLYTPPEVEGAAWILLSLTNPQNRKDLEALMEQSKLREKENKGGTMPNDLLTVRERRRGPYRKREGS